MGTGTASGFVMGEATSRDPIGCKCSLPSPRERTMEAAMPTVLDEIGNERARQVGVEGWGAKHDDQHTDKSLALAAALYAAPIDLQKVEIGRNGTVYTSDPWPWWGSDPDPQSRTPPWPSWDKRKKHDYRRRLIIAAALIVAEIERLDRAQTAGERHG